ncbi:MAG: hypothetical protein FWF67_06520 [Fibromonadales bacterium]|nr:hypothetical protein [Fibromonadales bacterium]
MNKMQSVQEHVKNAPGSYLSRLRTKFTQKNGLVQNSKIQSELCREILDEERLKKWMQKRKEWEALALGLIYVSGSRGLHFKELERTLETDPKNLVAFLNEAVSEVFLWQAKCQGSYIYYGFTDFDDFFLNSLFKDEETLESAVWLSNEKKAELHLLLLLSKIQLGKISIKKDMSISHSAKKYINQIFANSIFFDSSIMEDCIRLQFSFLIYEKWISITAEESELKLLIPAYEFLQDNGFRLFSEFIFWWEKERFRHKNDLLKLLKFFEKPISVLKAAQLFWPSDTNSRLPKSKAISWQYLPLPLRELWIFGILKIQVKKKHILAFSLSEFGENIFFAKRSKENLSEPIISNSSNFEWLLSHDNGAFRIFQMSCFAEAKNEEDPLRFVLSKESFLEGLRSRLPESFVEDFLSWNRASQNVTVALNEWHHIYSDSSIDSLYVLRIRNPKKFEELSVYKPFLSCVEEIIPNWGFVIYAENEKKIRGMLSHFSLEPHPSSNFNQDDDKILQKLAETENFRLPYPIPEVDSNTLFNDYHAQFQN